MGGGSSSLSRSLSGYMTRHERRLLLLGLDNAGKTTLMHRLCKEDATEVVSPTTSFTVRTLRYNKFTFIIWDVGGQDALRPYWRHYYTGTQGIAFVVDATDEARLELAACELKTLARDDQLLDAAIVVLVNKSDAEGAMSVDTVRDRMDLPTILAGHPWTALATSATAGDGLQQCCEFLVEHTKAI